jgi:hypothetical protein
VVTEELAELVKRKTADKENTIYFRSFRVSADAATPGRTREEW